MATRPSRAVGADVEKEAVLEKDGVLAGMQRPLVEQDAITSACRLVGSIAFPHACREPSAREGVNKRGPMPDIASLVQASSAHAWLYLPLAVALGAIHALEPGHAKSLMAAYIIAIRGTASQAVTLGISAAVGHTIIVWGLAIAALALGQRYIVDEAEPWLTALSGLLIVMLAIRMLWALRRRSHRHDQHDHAHDHHHHGHDHGHSHAPPPVTGNVSTGQIIWFGFTGGLMPCPSAIAVLLICVQLKAFALGVAMVGAFSIGVGATLVVIGLTVVWSHGRLSKAWPAFDRVAERLPYLSAGLVLIVGLIMTAAGLNATGIFTGRKGG
jgi:nickel/cobalt exporter